MLKGDMPFQNLGACFPRARDIIQEQEPSSTLCIDLYDNEVMRGLYIGTGILRGIIGCRMACQEPSNFEL